MSFKFIVNMSLQASLYSAQISAVLADTVSTVDVVTTSTALIPRLSAETQGTGTAALIYPDFYLPNTLDSRLSQIK